MTTRPMPTRVALTLEAEALHFEFELNAARQRSIRYRLNEIDVFMGINGALDMDRMREAAAVLELRGEAPRGEFPQIDEGYRRARQEIARGGGSLKTTYVGFKDYDRWHAQESSHPYGFGPKHGNIIFSIGLAPGVRERGLTAPEIESALYALTAVQERKVTVAQLASIAAELRR